MQTSRERLPPWHQVDDDKDGIHPSGELRPQEVAELANQMNKIFEAIID